MTHANYLWLPYTQMKVAPEPLEVVGAEGCRIKLADGHELVDGISSWWCMAHGYSHPHIVEEIQEQAKSLSHVMLGGIVHPQAVRLSERLCKMTGLERAFFSDSGSTAVEVALKMALQYQSLKGKPRKERFISFTNGYHGDTFGAMSVSDPERSMHKAFRHSVVKQFVVDIPTDEYAFTEFETLLDGIGKEVAGMIIEPLVQGAGGMHFHSPDVLAALHRLAKQHDILFIADEIATGFMRTGNKFACNEAGITPDIMCVGKALTGGHVGLGATLASAEIFDAFQTDNRDDALMHGPTFMANPIACAAANASLDLFEQAPHPNPLPAGGEREAAASRQRSAAGEGKVHPGWFERVNAIEQQLWAELKACEGLPGVIDVRVKGAIGVVQIDTAVVDVYALRPKFVEQGVWLRPFGDVVYLMPPLVIEAEELGKLTGAVQQVLRHTRA